MNARESIQDYAVDVLGVSEKDVMLAEYDEPAPASRQDEGDPFILIEGGLVVNDPALPVFDIDVIDRDKEDIRELIEGMSKFPQLTDEVERIKKFL